jgi:protoporphyrinogen oxidase
MTIAQSLAKAGRRVTLFEAAKTLGGLASAWQIDEVTWDRYYHVTLQSDQALRSLLDELGLDRHMCWRKTKTGFYHAGCLYPFSTAMDFLRFPLLGPVEKVRLGATVLYASRFQDWRALESVSVQDWLTRLSGKSVFHKIWRPLLLAKLGEDYRSTSATFIWATIQRMYAARNSGMKEELFGYLPGGYARMLCTYEQSLRDLGVELRLGSEVKLIQVNEQHELAVHLQSGSQLPFDQVVVTAPAPIASRLCPQLNEHERSSLDQVSYLGIICASALLRTALSGCYITNILDESIPFTGVIEMSALVDPAQFGDRHLIYIPNYLRSDDPDFARSDDDLRTEIIAALRRMYSFVKDEDFLALRISRSKYVFPRPTVGGTHESLPTQTSVPGLTLVNSAHIVNGTLNANETIRLARREAVRLNAQFN